MFLSFPLLSRGPELIGSSPQAEASSRKRKRWRGPSFRLAEKTELRGRGNRRGHASWHKARSCQRLPRRGANFLDEQKCTTHHTSTPASRRPGGGRCGVCGTKLFGKWDAHKLPAQASGCFSPVGSAEGSRKTRRGPPCGCSARVPRAYAPRPAEGRSRTPGQQAATRFGGKPATPAFQAGFRRPPKSEASLASASGYRHYSLKFTLFYQPFRP